MRYGVDIGDLAPSNRLSRNEKSVFPASGRRIGVGAALIAFVLRFDLRFTAYQNEFFLLVAAAW
jgi:hypothetical protein